MSEISDRPVMTVVTVAVVLFAVTFPSALPAEDLFGVRRDYRAGEEPESVAITDLDRDGIADLVVGTCEADVCSLTVLSGSADGSFAPAASLPTAYTPYAVQAHDLNGDLIPDLVFISGSNVAVRLANGDGTVDEPMYFRITSGAYSTAIGDVNNDGVPDLAVPHAWTSRVGVLLGYGDGSFEGEVTFATDSDPRDVAIGDLDGDGNADLVTANDNAETVSVLLGRGNGIFEPTVNYAAGRSPRAVDIGDLNGDPAPDLAVSCSSYQGEVQLFFGNGDGTLQDPVELEIAEYSYPRDIAIRDLDADGHEDLVVLTGSYNDSVFIVRGNGDGTFDEPVAGSVGNGATWITMGHLNDDLVPDLAVPNVNDGTVSVFWGNGDGSLRTAALLPLVENPTGVAIGDLDGDGHMDIAAAVQREDRVALLYGNGSGSYGEADYLVVGDRPLRVLVEDLDGDGLDDLAFAHERSGYVSVFRSLGGGFFELVDRYWAGEYPSWLVAGDVNGDGRKDLIATAVDRDEIVVGLGNGDGTFTLGGRFPAGDTPEVIALDDLNGDGAPDLAAVSQYNGDLSLLLNNGSGGFPDISLVMQGSYDLVTIADIDGDGHSDLVLTGSTGVQVFTGSGEGTFEEGVSFVTDRYLDDLCIDDFDEDGCRDIVVATGYSQHVLLYSGAGDGFFEEAQVYGAGGWPHHLAAGDLNHDGSPDLVTINRDDGSLAVMLNTGVGSRTVAAHLTCCPAYGTLPFTTQMTATLENRVPAQTRRVAALIDISFTGGAELAGWRTGYANVGGGATLSSSWSQVVPGMISLVGRTRFHLVAQDVTPPPYNVPPYASSGDTDRSYCSATGYRP